MEHHIDLQAIADNYTILQRKSCKNIAAVVKANAYGHGAAGVARQLAEQGCSVFFTGSVQEAVMLRSALSRGTIVALLGFHSLEELVLCERHAIIPLYHTTSQNKLLQYCTVPIAIKCDTGMSRLGFSLSELEDVLTLCRKYNITVEFLLSHLADSSDNMAYTTKQMDMFSTACTMTKTLYPCVATSLGNSATSFYEEQLPCDIIRCGIALYGYGDKVLTPVMRITTRILQIRSLRKGTPVGYSCAFIAPRDMDIAVIALGYADGYCRTAKNAFVLVDGYKAPIIGNICMQSTMIDVSHIPNVSEKSEVAILDAKQGLGADTIAEFTETIPYEILCSLGKRN